MQEIDEIKTYEEFEQLMLKTLEIYQFTKDKSYLPLNIFIQDKVWDSTLKYNRMMIKTKEKFFENLYELTSVEEYRKRIEELWGNIDHTYMDDSIKELQKMVIQKDFNDAEMYGNKKITTRSIKLENSWREYKLTDDELYPLNPERDFRTMERRYMNRHIKLYGNIQNRYQNSTNLAKDLANFVKEYDKLDKTIPYFSHTTGNIIRYVDINTYNTMLYNVNLTRSAWNRSVYDAKLLNNHLWYLPAHPYACPDCMAYQGKVYTDDPNDKRYPQKETAIDGGVGHPNCKHVWTSYWGKEQIQDDNYNSAEWEEKYKTQQKIQSLDLKKSRLLSDRRIYNNLGQQDLVDKTTAQIKNIRKKKKELEAQK